MKVLDLFSGIGGFSLGLEKAGFETVAFCEIDKKARLVLKKHWPDVMIYEDVTQLTKEKLDEHGISVDVICGGFPCQDLSVAGRGVGLEGARSGLWFEFHRLIKEIKPSWAIIENVSVLRSRGLDRVLRSLAEIGYDAEWHCIPASAVGAPHQRDRIWIIAYPNSDSFNGGCKPQCTDSSSREEMDDKLGGIRADVANAHSSRKLQSERPEQDEWGWIGNCGKELADTASLGSSGPRLFGRPIHSPSDTNWKANWFIDGSQGKARAWDVEPDVGRVAHGVPGRVDRLKQLGNAVVPQIPELIGRAIMDAHNG